MADPLEALKKAQTIGAARVGDRYAEPENPSILDMLRRFTVGESRPPSVAAEDPYGIEAWQQGSGQMPGLMGTTAPISQGPHPAISALQKLLGKEPPAPTPAKQFLGERLSGWVPHRPAISAPEGFELGGTSEFMGRDPGLVEQYVKEQSRKGPRDFSKAPIPESSATGNTTMQSSPYGSMPSRSRVAPTEKASYKTKPEGFESKFSNVLGEEDLAEYRRQHVSRFPGSKRNFRKPEGPD